VSLEWIYLLNKNGTEYKFKKAALIPHLLLLKKETINSIPYPYGSKGLNTL